MPEERETLRTTFNEDALLYDRARPSYPAAVFDEIDRRLTSVPLSGAPRTLEVGCGTGQASLSLARRGHRLLAVELGSDMARMARANLAKFAQVEVINDDFEQWTPENAEFDLVVSATAFHWLDPATRLTRVSRLLRPGGLLALIQTIHISGPSDAFFADVQGCCYERWDPETPSDVRLPQLRDLPATSVYEIEQAVEFSDPEVRRFAVDHRYDAEQYLDLLGTFSNHRVLPPVNRDGLLSCVQEHINAEPGQSIVKSVAFELSTAVKSPDVRPG